MKEIFKEHPSGLLVSNMGQVFVPKTKGHTAHYTYGVKKGMGYLHVGYNRKYYLVHKLVAECFIPNSYNLPYINHKDENPSNNRVENLEWCTAKYNNTYGTRIKRVAEKNSKPVLQFDLDGNFIKEWICSVEIERQLGYFASGICLCCKRKIKTYKGYIWKYKTE